MTARTCNLSLKNVMEARVHWTSLVLATLIGAALPSRASAQTITITPNDGSQQAPANSSGQTATFTVTNNSGVSTAIPLNPCVRTGAVTSCSSPAHLFVPTGMSLPVNVTFATGAAGSGTLLLGLASGADGGRYTVTVVQGNSVAVTPDNGAAVRAPSTGGHTAAFTVTNTGTTSNTFSFTCSRTGGVTCGTPPGAVTLAGGAFTTVNMPYSVGGPGTGTLSLTASGSGATDAGSYTVTIGSVTVTPVNGLAAQRLNHTGGHSESFTIKNLGVSATFTFSCHGVGGVTCGAVPSPVTLATNAQVTRSMPYSVGVAGMGTLVLSASSGLVSGGGQYNIPIVAAIVTVTPDGGVAPVRFRNTSGHSESFVVRNAGGPSNTFSFSCSDTGVVTCGTVPSQVGLSPGAQVTVTMSYSVGVVGTGTLTLTATGTNASDTGSYSVTTVAPGVTVTPDAAIAATRFQNTGGHSESFLVQNTGGAADTYTFSCVGTNGVICGTLPAPQTIGTSSPRSVTMPYSVGAPGAGTLTFTATGTGASNAGSFSVPIAVTLSSVTGGSFTKHSSYLLQETANQYDAVGRITQLTDARGSVTNYEYGGSVTNAFLTKVTDVHDATGSIDLVTTIAYDSDGLVSSIKDQGGSFRYFTYDLYGRLRQVKNHAATVVKAYGYTFSRRSDNAWAFQPGSPNAVMDSSFMQQTPTEQVVASTAYFDGLGKPIQAVVRDGSTYHVSATQYDAMGREWRAWRPYTRLAEAFDPSFATSATSFYTAYHGTAAKPYVETQYRADGLARVSKVIPEYLGTQTDWRLTNYGIDAGTKQEITETVDEAGKKARSYTDVIGKPVRSILGYGASEATTTTFLHNVLGERTRATDPRGLPTNFTLNTRGLLTAKASPDAGTVNSKYDRAGTLRFSQDANQAAAGKVYFVNYDFAGRSLKSGVGTATFSSLNPDVTATLETTQANWLTSRAYDVKPSTAAFPWSLFSTQISRLTLANVAGRLSAVASKSGAAWQVTLFSYDADGQILNRYTFTQDNAGSSVLTAVNTNTEYQRDLRGAVTRRLVTTGANTFYQWYDYDARGLISKLYAATNGIKPAVPDLAYTYRPDSLAQDYQFQGGPLVPLRYTIRGQMAQVGTTTSSTFPFAAKYSYNPNGTMAESEFRTTGSPATRRFRYVFPAYDALNRLKSADYSTFDMGWISTLAYDLAGINYDAAGNITAMQRYRQNASLIDNLTYAHPGTSNRLSSVTDAVATTTEAWDAETGSFTYDPNGNMVTAPAPYSLSAATYDHQNLPLSLTRSGVTSTYRYEDAGQRISKQVGTGNTEIFLREGATILGMITLNGTGSAVSWHFNLIWENRVVGRHPSTGNRAYYHSDMLGSTRAVVQGTNIVESYDYDPWGVVLTGRTLGTGTREGFGGKEHDVETGFSYFGARYYLPALGRWGTVDPAAEQMPNWSPYNYVYDNPSVLTDPLGLDPCTERGNCTQVQDGVQNIQTDPEMEWFRYENQRVLEVLTVIVDFAREQLYPTGDLPLILPVGGIGVGRVLPEVPATTPVGRAGKPLQVTQPNAPTVINGRYYTSHALDQMQARGLTPSIVEETIARGRVTAGREGATVYTTEEAEVILNANGSVKTAGQR